MVDVHRQRCPFGPMMYIVSLVKYKISRAHTSLPFPHKWDHDWRPVRPFLHRSMSSPIRVTQRIVWSLGDSWASCLLQDWLHRFLGLFTETSKHTRFYRAMLCIRGTSRGPVSVCPSVTSRSSTKTAKRRITQTTPHDTQGTLVFWCQRSPQNSTGVTLYEGAECRWGGSKSATFHIYPAISRKR